MKTTSCTELTRYAFENAPRCGARSKCNNGSPCRSPAVHGKQRCRMHGSAKGSGGQFGNSNALKHGCCTLKIKKLKKAVKATLEAAKLLNIR